MSSWLTTSDMLTLICERIGPMSQAAFYSSLRPVMQESGQMSPHGDMDRGTFSGWLIYLETRKNLIQAGKWASNRPYSLSDYVSVVSADMYEEYQPE